MLRLNRASLFAAVAFALALPAAAAPPVVRPERMHSAAEIQLDLERLGVVGSALYVAAHPDDENTAMISWLANGKLVRTGYLAATRGDGGQNLIGTEKGDLLGVIRTHELLEARKIDGGEQLFSRAIDFGYTKSPEETLAFWGKERILEDFVRIIRRFKPDVIISRFPSTGEGGHGQHTTSAILAEEAFVAAADPERFRGVGSPWQAKRIYWNAFRFGAGGPANPEPKPGLLTVDIGAFQPILGRSYSELAGESRSMHKSQGFGAAERRGSFPNFLDLRGGDPAASDPFEGVELTWKRVAGGEALIPILDRARAAFRPEDPSAMVPRLLELHRAIQRLPGRTEWERDTIERKLAEVDELIRQASGLWIEAIAPEPSVVPGGAIEVTVSAVNRSSVPARVWIAKSGLPPSPRDLPYNTAVAEKVPLTIAADAPFSHPFWLRSAHDEGAYTVTEPGLIGSAVADEPLRIDLVVEIDGEPLAFQVPVMYRWTDPVLGERYRTVEVHPPVTAAIESGVLVFPEDAAKRVRVTFTAGRDGVKGRAALLLPEGWKAEPDSATFALERKGAEQRASFSITPPTDAATGELTVMLFPEGSATPYTLSKVTLDYPHIPMQTLFPHATAKLVRADIARDGRRIGYVMGAGDEVPEALRQIGYRVTLLTDDDLEGGDLGAYDAIVVGVRAYNTRKRLASFHPRLFEWVAGGGTLVTQYNTLERDLPGQLGPYPFKLSRERVAVESAPVAIAAPGHPALTSPNRIGVKDFEGWVQERGLYFPSEWAPQYTPLLVMSEPNEQDKQGSILFARHGEGVFIYTPISFFRQLPAGVPGAYRLFANLIADRSGPEGAAVGGE